MRWWPRLTLSARASALTVSGSVFGISNTRGDPAHHRGARPAFKVFLVREAGFAEMDLGVDHPRQQMQSPAIDHLAGRSTRQVANGHEPPRADAQIARPLAVVVDHDAALEDQIVRIGHAGTHLNGA